MRTRPYSRRAVVGIALLGVGLLVAIAVVPGTLARFLDTEQGKPGTAAAATVVLGGRSTPPALTFSAVRSGSPRTVNLTIDYRGSTPATVLLRLPSGATTTSCTGSGSTWTDGLLVGSLTLTLGSQPAVSYCSLLDGTARTLVANVQPGTVTTVPIVATVGGLALLSRTEKAAILVRAVGGFTDQVAGTITITTGAVVAMAAAARTAPTPTTTVAAAAPATPPAACVAAGLTSFAETVTLTADRPRFVAAEDRPGAAGPFLVIGTNGDDTITGSAAGDCIVGGGGDDTIDGQAGDDVVLGGDGADRIDGGAGNDRLYGEAALDRLVGGPGADLLDGGADNAACDSDPADTTTGCTATVEPTATAAVVAPTTTAATTTAPPTTTAPSTTPAAPAPEVAAPNQPTTTTAAPTSTVAVAEATTTTAAPTSTSPT